MAYLELLAGNTAIIVFGFSIVMVFLVLAAQFESWTMPLAVILSVPLCMLSALIGVTNAKMLGVHNTSLDINIFTQIGLVVLVGLASKNSILIVQFAKLIHRRGKPIREATLEACRLRLRPIIMTSMAFILGVVPLLYAHGAGAEMRQSLGVAVFSGMLGVTFFGVMLTPVFFYVIDTVSESHIFRNPDGTPSRQGAADDPAAGRADSPDCSSFVIPPSRPKPTTKTEHQNRQSLNSSNLK